MRIGLAGITIMTLVVAVVLHSAGHESTAESWGNWAFLFMLLTALLPQGIDNWSRDTWRAGLRRYHNR